LSGCANGDWSVQDTIPAEDQKTLTVTLPALLVERIRAYRASKRLDNEAQAIRDLIERGLDADAAEPGTVKVDLGVREDRE
jgi:hypothetical protein